MPIKPGDAIPNISLPATGDRTVSLPSLKGKPFILYFYPKDNTPGCTQEGQDFRDLYADFQAADCEIFGLSRDSIRSHENFIEKYSFPFALLSDADEIACKAFDVIKEKNMYGKKVMGIVRSTYLFDASGVLAKEWSPVKVNGHAADVLDSVKAL